MKLEVFVLFPKSNATDELLSTYLIDFSFPEMMRDFFHAGAYFVCIIILFGSAIIPLSKHLFLYWALLAKLSPDWERRRHSGLILFDQLGRTAFVDLFLMGYVTCVFYTRVDQSLLGSPTLRIQLVNLPVRGIFFGSFATICSGALGQYVIWMHNQQQMGDFAHQVTVATGPPTASLLQRLCLHQGKEYSGHRWTYLSAFCVTVLLVAGCVLLPLLPHAHLVSFKLEGLAGLVADQGWIDFDLITAVDDMTRKSEQPSGTGFLIALYYTTVLIIPGILLLVALVLWFVPLHLRVQRVVLSLFPFWFSWCALDTLLVTTYAAYLELHMIGEFTFDHRFHTLCSDVRKVFGIPCVALDHHIHYGMLFLAAACVIFFLIFFVIARLGGRLLETARVGTESPNTLLWARPWERESPLIIPS